MIFQRPMTREVITVISPNPGRDMGFSVWKFSPPPDLLCQEVRGTRLINEEARKLLVLSTFLFVHLDDLIYHFFLTQQGWNN